MDGFRITMGKGIHFTVNGWTLSVQFGPGNYCQNRSDTELATWAHMNEGLFPSAASPDAEIALWRDCGKDGHGDMLPLRDCDDVVGHVSPQKVATILGLLATVKDISDADLTHRVRAILGN